MILATAFLSSQTLYFVLLGVATGTLTGLVGLGVVLVYRSSGVLNFSAGSVGALAAFVCYHLRSGAHWPWVACISVGLLVGLGVGIATQSVLSVFGKASLLVRLIVLLAVLTILQAVVSLVWSGEPETPNGFLPTNTVHLFGSLQITEDRLILIGLAVVLAAVLRYVYGSTLFGLATSAVSESQTVASLGGWSPRRIQQINFAVAGTLSAFAGICLAPIISLDGSILALIVVPALAAALVGRFSSFEVTMGAAALIGVIQAELSLFQSNLASDFGVSYLSLGGLSDAVPLLLIVVITVWRGKGRMSRGDLVARLPWPGDGRRSPIILLAGAGLGAIVLFTVPSWAPGLILSLSAGILILSVIVVTGYTGQLSLCQFAFAGFGAWAASRLLVAAHLPLALAVVAGVGASIPLGLLFGLPALRVRGVYLAVTTLALALMLQSVIFNNGSLTGGFAGTTLPPLGLAGLSVNPVTHPSRYGLVVLVLFVLAGTMVANLRRGRAGRRLLAVRGNERVAASLGVPVYGSKLFSFALSAGLAGLSGITLAFSNPVVELQGFTVFGSITAVEFAVIGGIGWVSGSSIGSVVAAGGLLAVIVGQVVGASSTINSWLELLSGVAVIVGLASSPDGAAAAIARKLAAPFGRIRAALPSMRRPPVAAADPADLPLGRALRPPATITVHELSVRFGGVVALDGVSFDIVPGQIVGLIGPNGAGKTTLLDAISGFTGASNGSIRLDGQRIDTWSPERRSRAGISRSWQAVELVDGLTVRENLLIAADGHGPWRFVTDLILPGAQPFSPSMAAVVADLGLGVHLDQRPQSLPQGIARLVGIARALVSDPRVLLLDEPCAGLDAAESAELGRAIRRIAADRGIGVLLVEHDVPLLMNTCDRIVVLDFGVKIAEGLPDAIRNDPHVVRAYLGDVDEPTIEGGTMEEVR